MNSFHVVFLRSNAYGIPRALEDIPHSLVTDSVPQVLQGTRDAVVAPRAVLLCHAPHEALDLLVDLRPTQHPAVLGTVELRRDEPVVPREKRVGLHEPGHLYEGQLP